MHEGTQARMLRLAEQQIRELEWLESRIHSNRKYHLN